MKGLLVAAHVCFVLFGLGSWITVNGIFSATAELMSVLPEKLSLPSDLSLAVQCSNIFLLCYVLYAVCFRRVEREALFVFLVCVVNVVAMTLLGFLWSAVVVVGTLGPHSVATLALTLLAGGACTVSSVVFLPVVEHYPRVFTTTFAVGEAATGLLAALISLVQTTTNFPLMVYFFVLAIVVIIAAVAYAFLRFGVLAREFRIEDLQKQTLAEERLALVEQPQSQGVDSASSSSSVDGARGFAMNTRSVKALLRSSWTELCVTLLLNFMESGAIVSVLPYCTTPYGKSFYLGALWGGLACAPVGSLATLVFRRGRAVFWACLWLPLCVFMIVNAAVPMLVASQVFGAFVVICIIVAKLLIGYTKALVYHHVQDSGHVHGMLFVGIAQQVGSSIGALVFFLLVHFTNIFS